MQTFHVVKNCVITHIHKMGDIIIFLSLNINMHCFYKTSKPIILMLMHISTATNIRATLDLISLIHGQLVMVVVIVTKKDK